MTALTSRIDASRRVFPRAAQHPEDLGPPVRVSGIDVDARVSGPQERKFCCVASVLDVEIQQVDRDAKGLSQVARATVVQGLHFAYKVALLLERREWP